MKERHSVEAPVSVHGVSISSGSTRTNALELHGLSVSVADDGLFCSTDKEYKSDNTSHELNFLESTFSQEAKPSEVFGNWLGLHDPVRGAVDLRLPEEESLNTLGEPVKLKTSKFLSVENATNTKFLSSKASVEFVDKLAAMNGVLKDDISMVPGLDGPRLRGPYNTLESELPYQHLLGRLSSPQFSHQQINRTRPLFQSLDHTLRNSQIKFMGPESMHHEPPHHPFPANNFHFPPHNSPGDPRFGPAHLSLLQAMPMPGNSPPPRLLQGLQRGVPLPHPVNHMAGYLPEPNPMQDFLLNHHQPNHDGFGMKMTGFGVGHGRGGGYHPELRVNSKQKPPIAAGHNSHGMNNGTDLHMSFRYR